MQNQRFFKEFIKTTTDCFNKGWNERNGGNLTYRLTKSEVETIQNQFNKQVNVKLEIPIESLKNEVFLVTGTNRYFRNMELYPLENLGIIKIDDTGSSYDIVWGLDDARPTSELPTHLLNHSIIMDDDYRVILHGHQTNLIALSFIFDQGDEMLTKTLWSMMTECMVVFPNGIKTIEWMVPGNYEIGVQTSKHIKDYDVVFWNHHGAFVKGKTFDDAFGLIDTVEKACNIYLKILSTNKPITSTISDENLNDLAKAFNVKLKDKVM